MGASRLWTELDDGAELSQMRFEGTPNKDGIKKVVEYDERDGKLYKLTRHVREVRVKTVRPKRIAKFGSALADPEPLSITAPALATEEVDFLFTDRLASSLGSDA